MKRTIREPFFEVGIKNYIYGDDVLELAKVAESASEKYDVDVLFVTPYADIRRVAEQCKKLIILAPYMDVLRPGRGMADVLPESIRAAGAHGVVVNHCERPMALSSVRQTIERANELDMISFACSDTIAETQAIAHLRPDIMNPEPTELIGKGVASDMDFILASIKAVKEICPDVLVEIAAGITSGEQVYQAIYAGAEGAGAASGIVNAKDPFATLEEMVANARKAYDDRHGGEIA